MPRRAKKPCNFPGCPELVTAGQKYCEAHGKKVEKQRQERYDRHQRDKRLAKFYSSGRWQKTSKRKLKANPLCEYCLEKDIIKPAECTDHIVPVWVEWNLRFAWSNLKSSCTSCNVKKAYEDKKKYGGR